MSRTAKVFVSVLVFVAAGGFLAYSSLADAEYYKYVHEVVSEPTKWSGKTLKVAGLVEAGSISEKIVGQKTERTFVLVSRCGFAIGGGKATKVEGCEEGDTRRILVRSTGPTPDTFKELAEVVAKGALVMEGDNLVVHATELFAKCPSKYEENQRPSKYSSP